MMMGFDYKIFLYRQFWLYFSLQRWVAWTVWTTDIWFVRLVPSASTPLHHPNPPGTGSVSLASVLSVFSVTWSCRIWWSRSHLEYSPGQAHPPPGTLVWRTPSPWLHLDQAPPGGRVCLRPSPGELPSQWTTRWGNTHSTSHDHLLLQPLITVVLQAILPVYFIIGYQ